MRTLLTHINYQEANPYIIFSAPNHKSYPNLGQNLYRISFIIFLNEKENKEIPTIHLHPLLTQNKTEPMNPLKMEIMLKKKDKLADKHVQTCPYVHVDI